MQAEKQFGYRRDELVGQKVTDIIPEGFAERLIADATRSVADALAQQIGMGIELSGRRKDGSRFPIEIMLSPLESAEGILVTAAIRNISARKKSSGTTRSLKTRQPPCRAARDELGTACRRAHEGTRGLRIKILEAKQPRAEAIRLHCIPRSAIPPAQYQRVRPAASRWNTRASWTRQAQDWIRRTVQAIGPDANLDPRFALLFACRRSRPALHADFLPRYCQRRAQPT